MKNKTSILLAGLSVALFSGYLAIHNHYPFYFQWDMDWISTLDSLLIQSGMFPDHVNHTGFGMYLLFLWTQKIAHYFGWVSFLNLSDAAQSGNPLLGAAEVTDFFRLQSVFVALAIVWILFWALRNLGSLGTTSLKEGKGKSVWNWSLAGLVFLVLGLQDSLFYHAALIRTELYSVLFLTLAFAAGVRALKGQVVSHFVWVGVFLGLSYFTKLQSFFLIFWVPLLLLLINRLAPLAEQKHWFRLESLQPRRWSALSVLLPTAFFCFLRAADRFELPSGFAAFTEVYRINAAAFIFAAVYLLPLVAAVFFRKRSRLYEALLAGFLLSFLAHFLVYSSWSMGWDYLCVNLKMLFFRPTYQSVNGLGLKSALRHLGEEFSFAPGFYLIHFTVVGWALLVAKGKRRLIALLEVLLLMSIAIGTRPILRDLLWREIPIVLWNLVLLLWLLGRGWTSRGFAYLLLPLQLWVQVGAVRQIQGRLDAHYLTYGWEPERWLSEVYGGRQVHYTKLVNDRIPAVNRRAAVQEAVHWEEYRKRLTSVFVNLHVDLRDVSTLAEGVGMPHSGSGQREVLKAVPSELQGGLLVRPLLNSLTDHALDSKLVNEGGEEEQKLRKGSKTQLAVMGRRDFGFYVFVPDAVALEKTPGLLATDLRVQVSNGTETPVEYRGFKIPQYAELPVDALKGAFWVIALGAG